ncbi:hypothetical protein BDF20DRAFT_914255 [Mycotypha africana]|uniref:uncharacterized protein n=1 Tax=Mycotypha africana TaxID=64632 RepID=UPI0022FFE6BC|nr:uncharacterized protein BDF20DRAFT_914255 [Mycotypha africana]KAI8975307.1 hypothetical protein BDF20DRAFT_914255 [Mycotypha africana]
MSPDTKLIVCLVNRILVRLPSNSGKKLESLENDPLINQTGVSKIAGINDQRSITFSLFQTVAALIELSKFRLPTITVTLVNLLDSIKIPPNEDPLPFKSLQSQLFILRLLSACLQRHWQYIRDVKLDSNASVKASSTIERTYEASIYSLDSSTHHSRWSISDAPLTIEMDDPPPFDESIAKSMINAVSRIIHQATVLEEKEYGQILNHVTQITRAEYYTPNNISRASEDIVHDIYKACSRVIAYLSASNWNVVFSKIKMRILYLATTTDENPETSEMRLLECCSLNSKRLSTVLSGNFPNLKKSTQLTVAAILRRAIWGWIETYPGEFMQLCQNQKKLEGGPDVLFEICLSLADTTRKKAILWPLQTMLFILCPDGLQNNHDNNSSQRTSSSRRSLFLASLKNSLKPGKMAELAAICYVDICKAATYVAKSETSILRRIVADIENELRTQLFDPEKPLITDSLMSGLGIIIDHRTLLADCLTAMFRLNPRFALRSLFPACLEQRAPTLFKISLVKACLAIAAEENRLPWNPSVTALYNSLASQLRDTFIEFASKDFSKIEGNGSNNNSNNNNLAGRKAMINTPNNEKKSKKDTHSEQSSERLELVLDMLRLYQTDPNLAIRGNEDDRIEKNAAVLVAITTCLREPNQSVKDTAAMCLYKLHTPAYILEWSPSQSMESFWKISSQVVFTLAKQLLDNREKDDGIKRLLDLLKRLFECRNEFLKMHQDTAMQGADTRERIQSAIALEVALLVLLCSSNIEICTSAITCFDYICTEAQLTEIIDDTHQSTLIFMENLPIYQQLSLSNNIITGRKSQQKQIRKLLRMMTHYAPGNLAAWEEVYKRWRYMTPTIMKPNEELKDDNQENNIANTLNTKRSGQAWHDKLRNPASSINRQAAPINPPSRMLETNNFDDDKSSEWQNYTGFLAALGGICLMADTTTNALSPPTPRVGFIDSSTLRRISAPTESSAMVNKFVVDMVDLLLCENVIVREWVKEILGTDLSPALYPMLLRYMETVLSKYFGPDGDPICNPRNTLFVEQAISVLKLVLDRMEDSPENLLTVDFSSLINQYARYLNKLGSGQTALKIKIKFCQLTEVLMAKKDKITLRQEFRLRNKLLEITVEWTSDFSLKPDTSNQYSTFEYNQSEKLHRELDLACLDTIVALLHQLPLQPPDQLHEADSTSIKSRIFFKYFTFFLKLLNRCKDSESENETTSAYRTRPYPDNASSSSGKNKENMSTYLAPLKESTILAMSNLLSANVDAGLKYSLSMGYHDDSQMRTAFMKVLTNILNQGTEFETLAETVITDRYEKLVDMLVANDLNIALSLCEVCPASDIEDAANALLSCFSSRGKTLTLLRAVIQREVQNTDSENELLRRTSIATRLLSVFAKQYGADYVRSVLQPVFVKLAEKPPEERTFELDPSKVGPGEDVVKNKQNVIDATELFLNAICASANEAPRAFRELCHCILIAVRERYPEAKYTAVGAFIFLRFFCPAIVAPESEGLLKANMTISREMKRGHLIATKVIQNLANNVFFGAKETYMIVLNDFLTNNIYKVTSFLREISYVKNPLMMNGVIAAADGTSSVDSFDTDKQSVSNDYDQAFEARPMEEKDYSCLHTVLFENMERISRELTTRRLRQFSDQDSATMWKRQFDKFSNLMAQLGRPPEISRQEFNGLRSYTFAAANQLYAEFMRRNSHRSVESIVSKNIFYETGVSKLNRPVFYFIARNVVADSIDFELLVYYMLQAMEKVSNRSFELVLDMTLFSHANEIPAQYVSQIVQLLPSDVSENLANIIVYNPNTHLRRFVKRLPRPLLHKMAKRTKFAVTLAEIYEFINPNELRLPKATTSLDTEQCHVFHPVNRVSQYKVNTPITIKVSTEYIQVMTVRKQEIMYGVVTVINDVFLISEIDDINIVNNARNQENANEFYFKYNKGKSHHLFSSIKREAIVNTIKHNKRRVEMTKPSNVSERIIRPNDVPGRLLNMALLNIGSNDPSLRLAAYNLLYALSITFHFEVGNQLLDAKDLCLPANSTAFIVDISEKIAQNQPALTLEFLNECFIGFQKSSEPLRYLCLDYMIPWLPNLSKFCNSCSIIDNDKNVTKTLDVIRNLIDLTVARTDMYKLVQAKIWKSIGQIDDVLNLVLDSFVQFAIEHGIGSPQAEAMADTFVTLSNIAVRGKVISRLRKVLQKTSFKPTRSLTEHWAWNEIAILIRFVLMLSFNNRGPVKSYAPEIFHIVSLVVGAGPTIIRASVHGLVINIIQSLCTAMPIPEANVKKLQLILSEMSDTKYRLLFGLLKPQANAFTITQETLTDTAEPLPLIALETIINNLLEVINLSAPSFDMANAWRARWMSLVASTAFQFNPAIQPQAFVALGCLGKEEVDDDLLYQILVALRGALAIFNESDPNLVLSIMMCLKNIVESLPPDSRYLLPLFWIAIALIEINNGHIFAMSVDLLLAIIRALDANEYFTGNRVVHILNAAREPIAEVTRKLDQLCGVNFDFHFSFSLASIFLKGLRYNNAKEIIFQGLTTFLNIESKHANNDGSTAQVVDTQVLGYLAGLLPIAVKHESLKEVLRLAGLADPDFYEEDFDKSNEKLKSTFEGVFDRLEIEDETTSLLLISMLANQLQIVENTNEKLFLYNLLAEAASSMPEVFSIVYDTLLPKMNQIVLSSTNQQIIESVKSILIIACSDPAFNETTRKTKPSQKALLERIGFSALGDPTFGASTINTLQNAKLASEIIELIIA